MRSSLGYRGLGWDGTWHASLALRHSPGYLLLLAVEYSREMIARLNLRLIECALHLFGCEGNRDCS